MQAAIDFGGVFAKLSDGVLNPKRLIPSYKMLVEGAKPPLTGTELALALDYATHREVLGRPPQAPLPHPQGRRPVRLREGRGDRHRPGQARLQRRPAHDGPAQARPVPDGRHRHPAGGSSPPAGSRAPTTPSSPRTSPRSTITPAPETTSPGNLPKPSPGEIALPPELMPGGLTRRSSEGSEGEAAPNRPAPGDSRSKRGGAMRRGLRTILLLGLLAAPATARAQTSRPALMQGPPRSRTLDDLVAPLLRPARSQLYRQSPPGPVPAGKVRGLALYPDSRFPLARSRAARVAWQGKVFRPRVRDRHQPVLRPQGRQRQRLRRPELARRRPLDDPRLRGDLPDLRRLPRRDPDGRPRPLPRPDVRPDHLPTGFKMYFAFDSRE